MKLIIKILSTAVCVVVILIAASVYYLDSGIKKAVETLGPSYLKTDVTLQDVDTSLFSGEAGLSGLAVGNPKGFSEGNAFYLGEIAVAVDVKTLRSDPVVVQSLRIISPEIMFEQSSKGNNLQRLLKNLEQEPQPQEKAEEDTSAASDGESKRLIVKDLLISGAMVRYKNALLGDKTLDLPLPDIHLQGIGEKSNGVTGAELAEQIITSVNKSVSKAVAQSGGVKALGKQLEGDLKAKEDKLKSSLDGIKSLFNK